MKEVQYTVRGVSPVLGVRLRAIARDTGRSINQVILDALTKAFGPDAPGSTDLDQYCGTWVEDAAFDRAVASFREVDPELWK
ncbi:MAG TPA: hypothetical protein VHC86_01660 [Opitutaceae bacterium]|nr:hypothetical protein [Opitutaceae bacterium]